MHVNDRYANVACPSANSSAQLHSRCYIYAVPANFVAYGQPDPRKEVAAQAQEAAKAIPAPTAAGVGTMCSLVA